MVVLGLIAEIEGKAKLADMRDASSTGGAGLAHSYEWMTGAFGRGVPAGTGGGERLKKNCAICKRDVDRSRNAKIYAALHLGA